MVLLASSYDESKYFKAVDLSDDRKVRIKSVTAEAVGTGADKQQKLVVWFTNDKRGLVLNRTNNRVLRGAFGDDTSGWAGKIIVIFSMTVEMHGKPTICSAANAGDCVRSHARPGGPPPAALRACCCYPPGAAEPRAAP